MARIGPFPMTTPPVYPGVYEIEGWRTYPGPTYARFGGGRWYAGGARKPERASYVVVNYGPLNDEDCRRRYRWYGVDEATSKGQA